MNQTGEIGKKPNSGPNSDLLDPNSSPNFFFFFCRFYLYWQVGIVLSYCPILFKGQLMKQT